MNGIRLVTFALDAILAEGETIDKLLARRGDRPEQHREAPKAGSTQGFPASREEQPTRHRSISPIEPSSYLAMAKLAPEAAAAIGLLKRYGVHTAIVSAAWEFAVAWFAQRLELGFHAGTTIGPGGVLRPFRPEDQAPWLAQLAHQLNIPLARTAAVGATEADIEMLRVAGTGFLLAPALAKKLPEGLIQTPQMSLLEISKWIVSTTRYERPTLLI